jgi:hypothetical protein
MAGNANNVDVGGCPLPSAQPARVLDIANLPLLGLLAAFVIDVKVDVGLKLDITPASAVPLTFGSEDGYPTPSQEAGLGLLAALGNALGPNEGNLTNNPSVLYVNGQLGGLVGGLLNLLRLLGINLTTAVLNPILNQVTALALQTLGGVASGLAPVLDPIVKALGIQIAGNDVTVYSVSCNDAHLVD